MNVLDLAQRRVKLRKVSGTYGGEWQGPCPGCGGQDRFHVWPGQQDGKGSYWCRGCDNSGDNIQFLIEFEKMTFKEACAELRISIPDRPASWRPTLPHQSKPEFKPMSHTPPADLWQEKAEKFISWSQENLNANTEALQWLAERGIGLDQARNYRLGWNPGEKGKDIYRARSAWGLPDIERDDGKKKVLWIPQGLVIPYVRDGIISRIRIRRPEGEPRYYVLPGSSMATMVLELDRRAYVVVESELDAIAVAVNNSLAGAVGLGSVSTKPDSEAFQILSRALQILVAIDYDEAGKKAMAWWTEHFSRCERWPVPQGKDPGEAYRMGTDLDKWIRAGLPPVLTIEEEKTALPTQPRREPTPALALKPDTPPLIAELLELLRKNPAVRIINTPNRMTVLRNGKYVGGRINHLVFHEQLVTEYILAHPAEEIDWSNFIIGESGSVNG
jgi:hypothetical protein